ncbi:putative transcriptional regulatory protein [Colletotrichum gloeosporioides]|uniref:Putative transcriptional regulatory protein n=1 Tax=Colletotrichum gloeosporioides TaxID=474922 RepID=A0A8H4CTF7_COLGL|nr:putative transcriptional regulatory protein [Colletotrichum gloeosporioides]KAF3809715.1 putative transcriptional regulatory protein [Colletotrichum gloeosporioides]
MALLVFILIRDHNGELMACRAKTLRPHYPGGKSLYISALEERIAFLEARMPDFAEDHFTAATSSAEAPQENKFERRESQDSFSEEEPSSLVDGVAYLSLCASGTTDTAPEPFYLGSSSGATIARMIQSSIFHGAGGRAINEAMTAAQPGVLRPPLSTGSPSSHSDEPMSEFPHPEQAKMLFDVFFDRLHTRWPILDRKMFTILFENQYGQGALPIQQRSILHLIYAISARFVQLMKKPCDVDPEMPSDDQAFWDLTALGIPPAPPKPAWSNMKPFIHIIKLRRIQSRIHRRVYRVDKDVFAGSPDQRAKLDSKMTAIRGELDEWARTIPHSPKDSKSITWMYDPESAYHDSRDFFNLQYHKSILSLFTVLLPTLNTSDPRFVTCARSAACVCTTYKRLNQQKTLSYTMMALHSCFIAGLTLVYCLWRDRSFFSYDALEATRACSQSLTIFGEKWPGAVKYRDIFDALSGSLFKTIVNPSSTSGSGLKPLKVDLEAEPGVSPSSPAVSPNTQHEGRPSMSHAISDAVKEAFMEVDEEAPGGWQGWRMFNEMVHDDAIPEHMEMIRHEEVLPGDGGGNAKAPEYDSTFIPEVLPIGTVDSEWDFGGLEGHY